MKTPTQLREENKELRRENRELRAQLDRISEIVTPEEEDDEEEEDEEGDYQ